MLHQDYFQKPKPFLLGSYVNYITFPIEKSNLYWNFWIQTIHNIDWGFTVDTTESDKTNNVKFSIYQKKTPENFRSIELDVGIVVDNLENSEYSIKVSGNYEFTEENNNMVIEIPGFDKIIDWKQGFFDDKAEEKKFKIGYNMVVKSVRLYDSVELFDFYNFDPTIFDTSVKAFGHTMFVSKKMISLQSEVLSGMIEAQNIEWTDLPSTCWFDIFHDFLQIIHGVDLFLYSMFQHLFPEIILIILESNIGEFLKLADHLKAPRISRVLLKLVAWRT
ncbi:hypothetical protein CRE_30988 [Caenorhabditis remanei]|uniref:BTB domain-containing protein n=1 Tax=Caenorhabditis remanei TaxID=31234 RepID=E3LTY3_CAERE|nr:hypothetical protein CRE_30988 [Caenorhabditis remanei]